MHKIDLPAWLAGRSLYRFNAIFPKRTALLAIDLQHGLITPNETMAVPHGSAILSNIESLAAAVREAGGLVVFTRHTVADSGPEAVPDWQAVTGLAEVCHKGTPTHELAPSVGVSPDDIVIDKYRYSALTYHSSSLNALLEARGIETVVVVGVVTNCCCESTARDASMLGYRTFVISDATAAMTDEEHNAALVNLSTAFADVRDTQSMLRLLERVAA